jgi:glycosyltransferase involved in cell wall biosynthesis
VKTFSGVIIAPCRNEGSFIRRTLDSLIMQTVRPQLIVVVDDGSTDDTPTILSEYASRHDWIRFVTRRNRGVRSVGPGVIEAFYAGLGTIDLHEFEYVCKLDLDLILPPSYFETLLQRMQVNPRLGSFSGKAYYPSPSNDASGFEGRLIQETIGDEVSLGMTKFYRTTCFTQIGGFVRQVMWDGIDCHRARMLGWQVGSSDDPELRFIHLRPMGASHRGMWTGRARHGYGQYFMGTGLIYMAASALFRMTRRPYIIGGAAIMWGYVWSMIHRKERYGDRAFRKFLRRYQREALILGKPRAARRAEARNAAAWNPSAPPITTAITKAPLACPAPLNVAPLSGSVDA